MDELDDLMLLTNVMSLNNGVLRRRDHPRSRATFDALVRSGSLVRVLPGVYVDATLVTSRRTRLAAALAPSPGAVLWGADAVAVLTGQLDERPFGARDSVLLAHPRGHASTDAVRWVRRRVPAEHRVRVSGLRCPSARYLAVESAARDSGALLEQLLRTGLVRPSELADLVPVFAGSPGQETRRRIVRTSVDNPWSGGERLLHALLRRHRVTGWTANTELEIGGCRYFPDVLFEAARLVVEFDGYEVHSKPEVFASDRKRQNALVLAGYQVLRYTWKQLNDEPMLLIGQVRALLARQSATDSAPL
jgi:very-short-patch-repair endonuclease